MRAMKLPLVLVAAVLAVATLAGCASSPKPAPAAGPDLSVLSPKTYAKLPPIDVGVSSSIDNVRLDNAVYLPKVPNGTRVPVYINFSPYHGDTAMTEGDNFAHYLIDEYVPRGYAVVLSAVRGTGHSGGCFQIGGDLELRDTYDVVDYFSKQPYSNGNVGAGAKSYDSTTQNGMVAKFPHPALKTILHVSGITDMYRYNAKGGVPYVNGLTFTPEYFATQGLDEYVGATNGAGGPNDESPDSLQRATQDAACPAMPQHVLSGEGSAADGQKDAYWQERDWIHYLPESSWHGSVFFVHGLSDWNVKPDNIDPWLQELQAHGNEVKGWLHQGQQDGTGHVYPMRQDFNETLLRWFDHYLKGKDTGIQDELGFEVQSSDGAWRRASAWPPAQPTPAEEAQAAFTVGGAGEQATYALAAAARDERIAGTPHIRVTATALSADPVLRAQLFDRAPDGSLAWVDEGVRRASLSDDLTTVQPVTAGASLAFDLEMYPVDHVLKAGHGWTVQLGIAQSDVGGAASPPNLFFTPAQQHSVTYAQPPTLMLPHAPLDDLVTPAPAAMRCWAC